MKIRSVTAKASALAGGAAAIAALPSANAAPVAASNLPVGPVTMSTTPTSFDWDVDNDGFVDFSLGLNVVPATITGSYTATIFLNSYGLNGRGWRGAGIPITRLNDGDFIAPGDPFDAGETSRVLLLTTATNPAAVSVGDGGALDGQGWVTGSAGNYAGFRFVIGSGTHYGWAQFDIKRSAPGSFAIIAAGYETLPDTGIIVGAVPEPSTASLALLALGSAGVAAWRRRKSAQS